MKFKYYIFLVIFQLLIFIFAVPTSGTPRNALLYLEVDKNGNVNAEITIKDLVSLYNKTAFSNYQSIVWFVAIPLEKNSDWEIISADDIKVSTIGYGQGYSLLAAIADKNIAEINFKIKNVVILQESSKERAQLEFYTNFPYMTQVEKNLINLPVSIYQFEMQIDLPKIYDPTEVNFRPLIVTTSNNKLYNFPATIFTLTSSEKAWIVFPHPHPSSVEAKMAKFWLSLLAGCLSILIYYPAFKKKNLLRLVGVFVLSCLILCVAGYYILYLEKSLDFMVYSAAFIPSAIFGLFFTVYWWLSKKYQVTIAGTVFKSGLPIQYAEVSLHKKIDKSKFEEVNKVSELDAESRYIFTKWQWSAQPIEYKVSARIAGAEPKESLSFTVVRSGKKEVSNIDL